MSTDPTTLAREVLDAAHEDETVTVCTIPDNKAAALARAVIAVENVLQGWLITAAYVEARGWDISTVVEMAEDIRDALNGENA